MHRNTIVDAALLIAKVATIFFVAEGLVMLGLALVPGMFPPTILALVDPLALSALAVPPAYFWVIRPYILAREKAEALLRQSETRFAKTLRASPGLFILLEEKNGLIRDVNESFCAALGFERAEVLGQSMASIGLWAEPRDRTRLMEKMAHEGRVTNFETRWLKKNGEAGDYILAGESLVLDSEKCLLFMAQDFSEHRRMEDSLHRQQKDEALSHLTGGIAHEFNNILMIVLGSLERIEPHGKDNPVLESAVRMAIDGTLRGRDLTRHLLSYSRKSLLVPKPLDLAAILPRLQRTFLESFRGAIDVRLDMEKNLWQVFADPTQFESSLLNIAHNARDVMPKGGVLTLRAANITIRGDEKAFAGILAPGPYVRLSLRDTGPGMDRETAARVFDPFFTTKDAGEGAGLGLSMSYGFVQQSGGHIMLETAPGKGTEVALYLPAPAWTREAPAKPDGAAARGHETILVVEDDAIVRAVGTTMLSDLGYDVLQAGDARAALDILEARHEAQNRDGRPVDLLFTDIVMPGDMDGRALAAEVRRRYPQLSLLYATGLGSAGERRKRAAQTGESEIPEGIVLRKPFRKHDLAAAVRTALQQRGE